MRVTAARRRAARSRAFGEGRPLRPALVFHAQNRSYRYSLLAAALARAQRFALDAAAVDEARPRREATRRSRRSARARRGRRSARRADPRGARRRRAADCRQARADRARTARPSMRSRAQRCRRVPEGAEDVVVNNRLRGALQGALAALKLTSPDRSVRLAAAKELVGGADEAALPLVVKALEKETRSRDPSAARADRGERCN